MSQNSGGSVGGGNGGGGRGPDFNLPDEILAVIPTDPYDQLDLARKITSMAIAARVTKLETETGRMKQKMYEKDRVIYELEEKLSHLHKNYQEADSRLKVLADDNVSYYHYYYCLLFFTVILSLCLNIFFRFRH